jgi:hypothetical protein
LGSPSLESSDEGGEGTPRTTTTSISGTVEAYEAGKTLTITRSDGSKVTYVINEKSTVPADLVIGKTVSILPLATAGSAEPVAQTITYVTTTKTETVPKNSRPPGIPGSPGSHFPGAPFLTGVHASFGPNVGTRGPGAAGSVRFNREAQQREGRYGPADRRCSG